MGAYPRLPSKPELLLPEDFASAIWEVALELDAAIEFDVVRAEQLARRELALLAQAEEVSGRRLHKGHPLHNLGVALHRSDPTEARVHFAAAHAEDARLWRRHRPAAWAFLAGKTLLGLFQDTRSQLRWLERAARRTPLEDPVKVGRQYAQQFDKPPPFPRRPEGLRSEADFLRIPADKRVFIGGSYAGARDRLDTMEDAVRSEGYEPVVVAESETLPGETNRAKSFRLLDRCNRAVFEGTVQDQPGWWPVASGKRWKS